MRSILKMPSGHMPVSFAGGHFIRLRRKHDESL